MRVLEKGLEEQLSKHINQREIDCQCDKCKITIVDQDTIDSFELFRADISDIGQKDTPLSISSGYRCYDHNQEVPYHANLSMHQVAALDIICPHRFPLDVFAERAKKYFNFVKTYTNPDRIHGDKRR